MVDDGQAVRRRRECAKCTKRFTTYEKVRGSVLWVVKKDGKREPFDREKVKKPMTKKIIMSGIKPLNLYLGLIILKLL